MAVVFLSKGREGPSCDGTAGPATRCVAWEDGDRVRSWAKTRSAAFSGGAVGILTIEVPELKVPHGSDRAAFAGLIPGLLSCAMSSV